MRYNPQDIQAAQEHFGFLRPEPVEKDWYVTQAIGALATVDATPFRLVFAGGTCLARAYRIVRRMSEDVDFKIVPLSAEAASGSQLRKQLGELRKRITASLAATGFPIDPNDKSRIRSRNDNHYTIYQLPYTNATETKDMLRPTIQIELTYTPLRQPSNSLPVTSFVAEAFGRQAELAAIDCVSITETAAEKIVALTRRTAMENAGLSRDPDPTLVRHIYDLHLIRKHIDVSTAITLAHSIAVKDAEEFKNQYPAYQADIPGETHKALIALRSDPAIRKRYTSFVAAMVYGDQVGFDAAIKTIVSLVEATWPTSKRRPNVRPHSP